MVFIAWLYGMHVIEDTGASCHTQLNKTESSLFKGSVCSFSESIQRNAITMSSGVSGLHIFDNILVLCQPL